MIFFLLYQVLNHHSEKLIFFLKFNIFGYFLKKIQNEFYLILIFPEFNLDKISNVKIFNVKI
jgi:hypothetical protein